MWQHDVFERHGEQDAYKECKKHFIVPDKPIKDCPKRIFILLFGARFEGTTHLHWTCISFSKHIIERSMRVSLRVIVCGDTDLIVVRIEVLHVQFEGLCRIEHVKQTCVRRNRPPTLFYKPVTFYWYCKCLHETWEEHYLDVHG